MSEMQIRQYQEGDNQQVKDLHVIALTAVGAFDRSGKWDRDLDHIPEVYFDGGDFLVGLLAGRIIAMGALRRISPDLAEVKRMRVHPDFQRRGFGQMILDELEQRARQLGYRALQLDTTARQVPAQRLYQKNGFLEIRRETEGWPLETIFYRKDL